MAAEKSYYCGSHSCLSRFGAKRGANYVLKDIPKDKPGYGKSMSCPDCNSMLIFRSKRGSENLVVPASRNKPKAVESYL